MSALEDRSILLRRSREYPVCSDNPATVSIMGNFVSELGTIVDWKRVCADPEPVVR